MKRFGLIAVLMLVACGSDDPAANGEACTSSSDCASELCVVSWADGQTVEGGQCTQECEYNFDEKGQYDGTDTCPEGQVCLTYTATDENHCYLDCETYADCRTEDGWSCEVFDFLGDKACLPPL